jgi:Zn-dependent protease with chaperone function
MRILAPAIIFLFLIAISPALQQNLSSAETLKPSASDLPDTAMVSGMSVAESETDSVYPMSPERKELLISYSRIKNVWRFAGIFIEIVILAAVLYAGLSGRFRRWAEAVSQKGFFLYFFYLLFLLLFLFMVHLPFDYYRGFVVEHDYGFSNQTTGEWFVESLKSLGVTFVLAFIVVSVLYWLINRFKQWWLYLTILSLPFMIFVVLAAPVVIAPMFNQFEPLKDSHLADEMTALAANADIRDPDIFEVDASRQSKKLNAYFTGMFGTRRIVLYDNIIETMTIDELKFVMGHEIGHYKMHHIWKGLLIAVAFVLLATFFADRLLRNVIRRHGRRFGFHRLGDPASLPLILLFAVLFNFVTLPIQNGISRHYEYRADEYGMKLSGVTDEVAEITFDKLSAYNLSDPEPPAVIELWFYDHPALYKRVENVKRLYGELQSKL